MRFLRFLRRFFAYLARYFRASRHHRRRWVSVPALRRALGDRAWHVGAAMVHETGIGILKPVVVEDEDVPLSDDEVLDVLDQVPAYWRSAGESLAETVVPETNEDGECGSESMHGYECELEAGHDGDHSVLDGSVVWPRAEMAVSRS